jgi:hypothetical protein
LNFIAPASVILNLSLLVPSTPSEGDIKKSEPKLAPILLAPKTTSQTSESAFDNFIAAVVPPALVEFTKSAIIPSVGEASITSNLTSGLVVPIPTD